MSAELAERKSRLVMTENVSSARFGFCAPHNQALLKLRSAVSPEDGVLLKNYDLLQPQMAEVKSDDLATDVACHKEHGQVALKFLHITKTGGTALEEWGSAHGYAWGEKWRLCIQGKRVSTRFGMFNALLFSHVLHTMPWHAPPLYFDINPYAGWTTFAIVRNPYERIISEFRCPFNGFCGQHVGPRLCPLPQSQRAAIRKSARAYELNLWIKAWLHDPFLRLSGHLLPQHWYVNGMPGERLLRHENLNGDFDRLARVHGLTGTPTLKHVNVEEDMHDFGVDALHHQTVRLINDVYAHDFAELGYEMM